MVIDCDVDVASSSVTLAPNFVKICRLFRKLSMGDYELEVHEKRYLFPPLFNP